MSENCWWCGRKISKDLSKYNSCILGCTHRLPLVDAPIIWVLGGPGSGKGTQCEKLVTKYELTHLSTGDLLRAEMRTCSERSRNIAAVMKKGELVPTDIVLQLLKEAIIRFAHCSPGFLVDGFPRELLQGIAFETAIGPPTVVLYFEASQNVLAERIKARSLTSNRIDDNDAAVAVRLKTFLENNDKILDEYADKLKRINAERTVDEIFIEVMDIVDPLVAKATAKVAPPTADRPPEDDGASAASVAEPSAM